MSASRPAPRLIAWIGEDQGGLLREILQTIVGNLTGIGSDTGHAAASLARDFDVPHFNDIRQAIHADETDVLLLAGPQPLDGDLRQLIRDQPREAFAVEPQFGSLADIHSTPEDGQTVRILPLMRHSAGFRAAADILPDFGDPHCVNVSFRSGPGQGTLLARLFDAADLISTLSGEPESLNAALAGPLAEPPESLPELRGHMTMNLRFKLNRCACVALSDRAGTWFRGVTVLGPGGCLRISDDGFSWHAPDGAVIEAHGGDDGTGARSRRGSPGRLIGEQILRRLEGVEAAEAAAHAPAPATTATLLAICEAARLSCRTAQDESPRRVLEMLSRP